MNKKMQIGDTVKVIKKNLMSYENVGVIVDFPEQYPKCAIIQFDNRNNKGEKTLYVKKENLERTSKIMDVVIGNYRVALVKFIRGNIKEEYAFDLTRKKYAFALFDNNVSVDDYVLCDTVRGYGVAKVVEIQSQFDYTGVAVTKEIVCKVDMKQYEMRKYNRQREEKLKRQMEEIVASNQNLIWYRTIAESNPEMKAMLEELESLE